MLFASTIQTFCDWGKEKQFLRLRQEIMNEKVNVLRGQYGTSQTVYVKDLVVGDVVLLEQGDRVPADCFLLEEMDMHVDQKYYYPDQDGSERAEKQCSYQDVQRDIDHNPDPLLLQDSIVMSGSGKAVVLAVGEHTLKEKEIKAASGSKNALKIEDSMTPFQKKLKVLSEIIGVYAYYIAMISLVLFGVVWLIQVSFSDYELVSGWSFQKAIELASTALALLIVCIPEGMPLVISMAMAFSVDQLKGENLLIKNLDALETSGQVVDILTGKTATLTTGDMEVSRIHICDQTFAADGVQANLQVLQELERCVILNCDAHMQMNGQNDYVPVGSPVEVGLLNMLISRNIPVQDKLMERERELPGETGYKLLTKIPFSSERKRMVTAYRLNDRPDTVRIVVKGAPEYVVPMCSNKLNDQGEAEGFDGAGYDGDDYLQRAITQDLIIGDAANVDDPNVGLKAITIAYREMDAEEYETLKTEKENFEKEDDRALIESELTYLATVGLSDPMREGVQEAHQRLHEGKTNVRILSGDHKNAAMIAAVKLGLFEDPNDDEFVISSKELEEQLDELLQSSVDEAEGRGLTYIFKNKDCKRRFTDKDVGLKNKVLVVYRATPSLKHKFTCALRNTGAVVAVTGEGLSDARAISEADVGFAMGEDGCAAAKDHADVILMDDNFLTVVNAIRWGRNIQDNVRKFVTFQMTVNLTCLLFVITTTLISTHSPFTVVQLLWINLIMDVLAAIAFATENPHPTEIRKERIRENQKIFTKLMVRNILFMTLYQLIVMIVLMYAGPAMFHIKYDMYKADMSSQPPYRMQHQTFLFQTFVMMSLFNMVNCRVLGSMPSQQSIESTSVSQARQAADGKEFNIFARIHHNWWFLIVLLAELNIQFFMVGYQGVGLLFQTTPLTFGMHLTAFLIGLSVWGVAALIKLTPDKLVHSMPEFGEDQSTLDSVNSQIDNISRRMSIEEKQQQAEAGDEFQQN